MAWEWLNKIVKKVAEEVHKSKIEEFKKRIQEMERKHEVILKTLADGERKLEKLDDRLYHTNMETARMIGAVNNFLQQGKTGINYLPENRNDGTENSK